MRRETRPSELQDYRAWTDLQSPRVHSSHRRGARPQLQLVSRQQRPLPRLLRLLLRGGWRDAAEPRLLPCRAHVQRAPVKGCDASVQRSGGGDLQCAQNEPPPRSQSWDAHSVEQLLEGSAAVRRAALHSLARPARLHSQPVVFQCALRGGQPIQSLRVAGRERERSRAVGHRRLVRSQLQVRRASVRIQFCRLVGRRLAVKGWEGGVRTRRGCEVTCRRTCSQQLQRLRVQLHGAFRVAGAVRGVALAAPRLPGGGRGGGSGERVGRGRGWRWRGRRCRRSGGGECSGLTALKFSLERSLSGLHGLVVSEDAKRHSGTRRTFAAWATVMAHRSRNNASGRTEVVDRSMHR